MEATLRSRFLAATLNQRAPSRERLMANSKPHLYSAGFLAQELGGLSSRDFTTNRLIVSCNAQESESRDNISSGFSPKSDIPERKRLEELDSKDGVTIRRCPPTGPPLHYVGPLEFRLQNEGNTPRNTLEEIVWNKDQEVKQMKDRRPISTLTKGMVVAPPVRDFIGALKAREAETGMPALIAELKKASPASGVIQPNISPVEIARAYEKGGAACISVNTDSKYYQGSFEDLQSIRGSGIQCPLLCKEFIIDAWQLYYARLKGADAVLLIASILPDQDIKYMAKICKVLRMAAFVEVSNEREMDRVLGIDGIELIAIQNQNFETFEVDVSKTEELLQGERGQKIRDRDIIVVVESGLSTPDDIASVQRAGARAVLVGEYLVKQDDPAAAIAGLLGKDISFRSKVKKMVA